MPGLRIAFDNSYIKLPESFYAPVQPTAVAAPRLLLFNQPLAQELGIDLGDADAAALALVFAGNQLPAGAQPISLAYAGHQFGGFAPQLGDGRAILLGEVWDRTGQRRDIQLKGSGRTPYSRRGDGRAALGPVLREYVVSEAMHALGVPSTRALAAVASGEVVYREQALPGAVLTRVAASQIRVGSFEFYAARGDLTALRQLGAYVLERHYPAARASARPYYALLQALALRHARLVAQWLALGFIHGVMNTDNMSIAGETLDYGPCAFLEAYDPAAVFSAIDTAGRYAYGHQSWAAQWNLARFAESILGLIDPDQDRAASLAEEVINAFPAQLQELWLTLMRPKLGLTQAHSDDRALIDELLECMQAAQADFTLTFRELSQWLPAPADAVATAGPRPRFAHPGAFDAWTQRWHARLGREPMAPQQRAAAMQAVNPVRIPRNHLLQRALDAAVAHADLGPVLRLHAALAQPYESASAYRDLEQAAPLAERVTRTYCGT